MKKKRLTSVLSWRWWRRPSQISTAWLITAGRSVDVRRQAAPHATDSLNETPKISRGGNRYTTGTNETRNVNETPESKQFPVRMCDRK